MPLSDFEDKYRNYLAIELGMAKQSITGHMSSFRVLYRALPQVSNFTYESVVQFLYEQKQIKSPNAIRYYVNVIQKLCTYLHREGVISDDFGHRLKAPRPKPSIDIETFDANEMREIQNAPIPYDNEAARESFNLTHAILARTGMRIGELCSLKVRHIDFTSNTIKILETKTDQPRIVPIPTDLTDNIKALIRNKDPNDWVFTNSKGRPMSNQTVWRDLQKRVQLVGIKKRAYIHLYRHSFATIMLANGCPLPLVSEILGHRNISTTQRYTHLLVSQLSDAMTKYHPLIRQSLTKDEKIHVLLDSIQQSEVFHDQVFSTNIKRGNNHLLIEVEWPR